MAARRHAPDRDSHDLSLSPRDVTRDSLIANMLLSLDQLSLGQMAPNRASGDDFATRLWANAAQSRPRHESADGDRTPDTSESPGSSGFRPGRSGPGTASRPARRAARRKGSSAGTSIDAGYLSEAVSRGYARAMRRSASFDHALQQLALCSSSRADRPPGLARGALAGDAAQDSQDSDEEFCAAPMPSILSGPRREPSASLRNPLRPPLSPPPEPNAGRSPEYRRSSSRPPKSPSARSKRVQARRATSASSPPADADLDSAPVPSVGYRKAREKEADASATAPAPAKERPGFFRRVFGGGSSRNNLAALSGSETSEQHQHPHQQRGREQQQQQQQQKQRQPRRRPSANSLSSPDRLRHPGSHQRGQQAQSRKSSAPLSTGPSSTSLNQQQQPSLHKKPSSFFRRRKKPVVDESPVPPNPNRTPPPVPVPALDSVRLPPVSKDRSSPQQKSPTSSLRIVMNPYIAGAPTGLGLSNVPTCPLADITNTPAERAADDIERYHPGFSPGYEPSPKARIRTVRSTIDDAANREDAGQPGPPRSRETFEAEDSSFLDLDGGSDIENGSPEHSVAQTSTHRQAGSRVKVAEDDAGDTWPGHGDTDATVRASKKPAAATPEPADREPSRPRLTPPPVEEMAAMSPGSSDSTGTDYKTAPSAPPSVRVEGTPHDPGSRAFGVLEVARPREPLDEPDFVTGAPTEDDRQKAQKIFDGGQDFIPKAKAASWMGEEGTVRQRTLQAYMELYDFENKSVLSALRGVCGRLILRAETQQVDRILVAFSKRWCACNPHHGFKAMDVIHTICYSIMLLNTDLHLADIDQKMTRSQFVKNTMTTILQALSESAPAAFSRPSILPERDSPSLGAEQGRASPDSERVHRRSAFLPRSETQTSIADDCGPLVRNPFYGSLRSWEEQVETVLKHIYASIRDQRLPLFGAEPDKHPGTADGQSSLSVMSMLKRSPSVLSRAPSETQLSSRGRVAESGRTSALRWTSKSRSRPGLGRNGFSSSRTSFDDGNSMWSPAMSSATWSRYSLGRTQGSMSQDSFASSMPRGDYQQSIGFANALSQAIVREDEANGHDNASSVRSADMADPRLLEDETLELAGPPWIKEGMVIHKHHLDGVGKKVRDRNWTEVFAVVQKGQLSLFSFTTNKSALRQRSRARNMGKAGGPVGGGNWQENAVSLGNFNLRLTLASALPPPGYSRTRPHVWALSLPTGAVHLFQVGTPEIIREFVNTANYWSARLSTHPMVGGISNVEYGWGEAIINMAAPGEAAGGSGRASRPGTGAAHGRKLSIASGSFRPPSLDQEGAGASSPMGGRGGKLPGDRVHIAEWAPPTQSMRPSRATDSQQLASLTAYVKGIEEELKGHNQLRSPMLLAFTARGHNAGRAMANWERKSAYLLREIVKFRTYVDCLRQAATRKREVYSERTLARKAARGELSDGDMDVSDGEDADDDDDDDADDDEDDDEGGDKGGDEGDETLRPT